MPVAAPRVPGPWHGIVKCSRSSRHEAREVQRTLSRVCERRQFITNRTARTQDNKNVGRKPVTHRHRREREKKRERERNLRWRKRREGGHGSAEARKASAEHREKSKQQALARYYKNKELKMNASVVVS
jgi:hypothetical protein